MEQHADAVVVSEQVLALFCSKFAMGPALGIKPLELIQDDVPRAVLNGMPGKYIVAVTCLRAKRFNQLVYQLGHEFLHVFANPYLIHPLMEVLACATSLVALSHTARAWRTGPASLQAYADKFDEYKDRVVRAAWANVSLDPGGAGALLQWQRTFQMDCSDRNAQLVAASLVAPTLDRLQSWAVLRLVQSALPLDQTPLGADWRASVNLSAWLAACRRSPNCGEEEAKFVEQLGIQFGLHS